MKHMFKILLLAAFVSVSVPAAAQHTGGFGMHIGLFSPDETYVEDWYDDFYSFGLSYLQPMGGSTNIVYALEYMKKDGDDYLYYDPEWDSDVAGDSTMTIVPLTVTLRYQPCTRSRFCPYVGAGVGYYMVEEEIDAEVYDYEYDEYYTVRGSDEDNVLGLHAVVGFDARTRTGSSFTGEVRWSTADGEIWGEDLDFGGLTASVGYRFTF